MKDKINSYKDKVINFYHKQKRMPTYSEIAKICGYKSKDTGMRIANYLEKLGFISKDKFGKLLPLRGFSGLKVLGVVEAGFPTPAEESLLDTMSIDDFLIRKPESTFMLKVKGDSMIDAGIYSGDLVLAERQDSANPGQIVVADIDGGFTMKYLRKNKDGFYLEPANESMGPIYPNESLHVVGIVVGVVRKYA